MKGANVFVFFFSFFSSAAEKSFFNRTKLIVGCVRMWLLPHFFFFFHFGFLLVRLRWPVDFGTHITCHGAYTQFHTHTHAHTITRLRRAKKKTTQNKCDAIEHKVAKLRRRHYCLGWRDDGKRLACGQFGTATEKFVLSIQRTMSISLFRNFISSPSSSLFFVRVSSCSTYYCILDGIHRIHASQALHTEHT